MGGFLLGMFFVVVVCSERNRRTLCQCYVVFVDNIIIKHSSLVTHSIPECASIRKTRVYTNKSTHLLYCITIPKDKTVKKHRYGLTSLHSNF